MPGNYRHHRQIDEGFWQEIETGWSHNPIPICPLFAALLNPVRFVERNFALVANPDFEQTVSKNHT
jgi:hypothetical protein